MDSAVPSQSQPAAGPSSSNLTPTLFKTLFPRPYLQTFLQEGLRPDGRPINETDSDAVWRDASVNTGSISTAPASTLVRLGNTTVVCGVTLEVAPPELSGLGEGFIVPNIDLPPLCSSLFRPGPPSDASQVLSTRLREILIASNVLPLDSLLIEYGKAAFVVYLDVVCLNYDGGVLDAAVLACVGAIRKLTLPTAVWDPDTNSTTCEPTSATALGKTLPIGAAPVCVSFGVSDGHLLPDPTLFESDLCQSQITIALSCASSGKGKLINIHQAGAPLNVASGVETGGGQIQLKRCIDMARTRAAQLQAILEM